MQTIDQFKASLINQLRVVSKGFEINMQDAATSERKNHYEVQANTIRCIAEAIDENEDLFSVFDIPTNAIVMIKRIETVNTNPLILHTNENERDTPLSLKNGEENYVYIDPRNLPTFEEVL